MAEIIKEEILDAVAAGVENAKAGQKYIRYHIQSGDTLWGIAQRYGTTVDILMEINKGIIEDRNRIYPSMIILVPVNA